MNEIHVVPDFIETDEKRRQLLEKLWGCKINANDRSFHTLHLQVKNPPTGYCSTFVDRKWGKNEARKDSYLLSATKKINQSSNTSNGEYDEIEGNVEIEDNINEDPDFHTEKPPPKKRKYEYVPHDENDDMPIRFRNLRDGLRKVRPEVYALMLKLKSKHHMSQDQAKAAIVETGNYLFERKWKYYDPDPEHPADNNSLPSGTNICRVEPYYEAMALSSIVEEVMNGKKVVMYANDGSSMNGVGSYVVQSITIDGVQRPLPTFSIFTESRESLEELESMTLRILSAACGYKYTEQDLLGRIDFVMTDSTSHNLNVMENVCHRHKVDSIPKQLLCNMHPLLMLQRKVKDVFQVLHDKLGKNRIIECFLVDVDFAGEDFITKAIKCLTSFISKDYSSKPWNRQKHFDTYIAPKSNESISYKDHRFNRLFQCCMVLVYHIDDIASYLDTYRNVVNGISILDRTFVEMTLLKPVFCAVALIGIHITIPFQTLLLTKETTYSTLLESFTILYNELISIDVSKMCSTEVQLFKFVSSSIFENVKKHIKTHILDSITSTVAIYKEQITNIMELIIPKLAEGLSTQRGKIFGFGPEATEECVAFKISTASEEEMEKLNSAPIHNLGEERSVGSINYELGIRGKRNLESSSKKLILNKSFDLLEKSGHLLPSQLNRQAARDIKLMKIEWNEKMKEMERKGNLKKDEDNNHLETIKYKDLEYLKARNGPFTTVEEVENFDKTTPDSEEKNKRLYIEVRYAKNTCLSLKHTASVFRLKKQYKNLTSEEYVENLCQYLGGARSKKVLTENDLSELLKDLLENPEESLVSKRIPSSSPQEFNKLEKLPSSEYNCDELVAAVWIDEKENDLNWFLRVVNSISTETIGVTYYNRKNKDSTSWTVPEDDIDPVMTPINHIIYKNITVSYGVDYNENVRCTISKQTVIQINDAFQKYINQL